MDRSKPPILVLAGDPGTGIAENGDSAQKFNNRAE